MCVCVYVREGRRACEYVCRLVGCYQCLSVSACNPELSLVLRPQASTEWKKRKTY